MEPQSSSLKMKAIHQYARLSMLSIIITAVFITAHHLYKLGPVALVIFPLVAGSSYLVLRWFRNTKGIFPIVLFALLNLWIIFGFGLSDGLWNSTVKIYFSGLLFPDSRYFLRMPIKGYWYEVTGILTFAGSLYVLYYGYNFLKNVFDFKQWNLLSKNFKYVYALLFLVMAGIGYNKTIDLAKPASSNEVIKIGVTIPMEGPGKLLGSSFLKAVLMANEDLGTTKHKYQLVVENSGTTPAATEKAIQKLIEVDKINAIVGGISASGRIIKPYASSFKIPHLCVCSIKMIGDGEYNFTNIPLAEDEAEAWVNEAKRRGIKTIAVINQQYPSIQGHVKGLEAVTAAKGLKIIYEKEFDSTTTNFTAFINQAAAKKPDVFFISGFPPLLDLLGQQLKEKNITNISSFVALSISNKPSLFEGNWYTDSYVDMVFKARFEKKYPGERFATHMMPYAYDSYKMMVQAFESGQDPAEYLQQLTNFNGTAGLLTRKGGEGNFRSKPAVWIIKNGQPELLTENTIQ